MIRAVVDPGVLISALLSPRGNPAAVVRAFIDGEFEMVCSPLSLSELAGVLSRPKFKRWVTSEDIEEFAAMIRLSAVMAEDPPPEPGLTPDPGDDYLVALARSARADVIISGDEQFLGITDPQPPVMSPAQFRSALGL